MSDPGYRVPEGDALIEDMACQLVYYPDIPEYRTILLSQLLELTNWRNWERDDDHKGKDAATSWKAANVLTWECWRMACLEQLQSDVSAILAHLQATVPCCGDIITYGDSTTYVTTIIPGSGEDPTLYGETEVSDWDEWKEYLCHNANLWVDELIAQSNAIETVLDVGGLSVGLVAYALAAVALFVVGGFISGPIVIAVTAGLIAGYTANMFSDAADELEAGRDDIVCAIMLGNSLSDAIEEVITSNVAWNIFYNQIDYVAAIAILYEGGDGTTYLEAESRTDCNCDQIDGEYRVTFSWEDGEGWDYWTYGGTVLLDTTVGNPVNSIRGAAVSAELQLTIMNLTNKAGLAATYNKVTINTVKFDYKMSDASAGTLTYKERPTSAGSWTNYPNCPLANTLNWTTITENLATPRVILASGHIFKFLASGSQHYFYLDNVIIDFDAEEV